MENYPLGVAVHSVSWWAIHGEFLPDPCPFFLLMSEQRTGCSWVSGPHLRSCLLLPGMSIVEIVAILSALRIKTLENCSISKCVVH